MILDEIDLKILIEFLKLKNKETTTWKIMKEIYPNGRDREHMRIKKKIERMSKHGLFKVGGKPKSYCLYGDKVLRNKIPILEKSISINVEGKWEIFEL